MAYVGGEDHHVEAGGTGYRAALTFFFALCATGGVPPSWSNTMRPEKIRTISGFLWN